MAETLVTLTIMLCIPYLLYFCKTSNLVLDRQKRKGCKKQDRCSHANKENVATETKSSITSFSDFICKPCLPFLWFFNARAASIPARAFSPFITSPFALRIPSLAQSWSAPGRLSTFLRLVTLHLLGLGSVLGDD